MTATHHNSQNAHGGPLKRYICKRQLAGRSAWTPVLIAAAAIAIILPSITGAPTTTADPKRESVGQRFERLEARVDALEAKLAPAEQTDAPSTDAPRDAASSAAAKKLMKKLTPDGKPRCQGIATSKKRQCKLPAIEGSKYCRWHDPEE